MSKHKRAIKRISSTPPWYFLGFLLISLIVTGLALRSNYQRMDDLRQAVYVADEQNGDVQGALQDLQAYVTTHMNTNLSNEGGVYPPIQLKYTYERLVTARSEQTTGQNSQMYQQAQTFCEQQIPTGFSGSNRINCIQDYVQKNTKTTTEAEIPDALYKFSFVSPAWSPDFAGWMVVVSSVLLLTTIASFIRFFAKRK